MDNTGAVLLLDDALLEEDRFCPKARKYVDPETQKVRRRIFYIEIIIYLFISIKNLKKKKKNQNNHFLILP